MNPPLPPDERQSLIGAMGPALPAPVLIVEDDALMRERLQRILGQLGYTDDALVFTTSLAQARAQAAQQPHALALVDLGLPDGSGVELIAELRADDPGLGILVISAWSTEERILTALRAGATGYVLKERDDLELVLAVRSVLRGGAPIDPFIARRILDLSKAPASSPDRLEEGALTSRENEILRMVAQGMTNREIAETVFLSRHTVECHIKHIYRKLAVSTRTRAVHEARTRGWLA
ncbi:response regulator transcription factor [Xenophilus arseniciresistens]|uniref:Response regulator transcription factor n=1 Tax=Xenophilus arseniciresistens TaxID=1283306 RepID=A0AAE3NBG7_9BURK|nr:response regulator transcription factor [Xenophilus arseniciresistens]MDA7417252.1 response regulator transcription factor [Xenophilus arseniciresistens]